MAFLEFDIRCYDWQPAAVQVVPGGFPRQAPDRLPQSLSGL